MIYVYAVEPELFINFESYDRFINLCDKFGFGNGRIIADFPHDWFGYVSSKLEKNGWNGINCEITRLNMLTKLEMATAPSIEKTFCWDQNKSWLSNFCSNDIKVDAIFATRNTGNFKNFYDVDSFSGSESLGSNRTIEVAKNAKEMLKAIDPLLRNSSILKFYDPHFAPTKEYLDTFKKFLKQIAKYQPSQVLGKICNLPLIEIHTAKISKNDEFRDKGKGFLRKNQKYERKCGQFLKLCSVEVPELLENSQSLNLVLWNDPKNFWHDRFIMSNLGQLEFTYGFGEKKGALNKIILWQNIKDYEKKLRRFSPHSTCTKYDTLIIKKNVSGEVNIQKLSELPKGAKKL